MKLIFRLFFRAYRLFISPYLGKTCRFSPSCSYYAQEAIQKHGVFRGGILAFVRILKCQPFYRGHYRDPVPETFAWPWQKKPGTSDKTTRRP